MDVIIVDDEPSARRTLREFCAREPDLHIVGEFGDAAAALQAIAASAPDLLFLDMEIGSVNGVDLVRSLDAPKPPIVVFVTAYDHYAVDAFEVNAIDYLLKPFDEERFRKTILRVRQRWQVESAAERQHSLAAAAAHLAAAAPASAPAPSRLLAESGGRMHMLDVADVEAVEAERNYVRLTVGRDAFHSRSTLQQAEKALQGQPVLRISRSCLINLNHVREVGHTPRGDFIFVLAGGATVTSSEGFREAVRQSLGRFKLGAA